MASDWPRLDRFLTHAEAFARCPEGWAVHQVSDLFTQLSVGKRFDKKMTVTAGRVPVIDQSRSGNIGFHNESPGVLASAMAPIVTFANHTCEMRLMRDSFSVIQNVFPLRPSELCDSAEALYYLTKGRVFLEEYKGHFPTFRSCYVCVPPLPEQRAIAATLGALDDKIEVNRKMNATLEAMARALFRDWFVDFGPTRAKMEARAPTLSPDLWSLFPDRLDDEGKPEGWEERPIKENCTRVANGGTPKRDVPAYWVEGHIPWLSSGEVRQKLILETASCITTKGMQESSAKLVAPGSTVVALYGATAGQVSFLTLEVTTNQAVCSLTPKPGYRAFNFLKLSSETETLLGMATGSAQQNLSKALVENFPALIGPEELMDTFETTVAPWFEKMIQNERESRTLAQTRDLLLPRLMSGELRVAEADRLAQGVA